MFGYDPIRGYPPTQAEKINMRLLSFTLHYCKVKGETPRNACHYIFPFEDLIIDYFGNCDADGGNIQLPFEFVDTAIKK
ncbi:hypothetical protein L596_009044 [Steinernema carpocapsae]|uniref:Uncharacterized protein n=1 Tax=Steinernema carpocapsae TaxID=34508 RepID=A0A4U5PEL5_STECR|nr:hypothetical protein L596_009044 [Steinernema carpocapsae]